jgi:hypothetical protein
MFFKLIFRKADQVWGVDQSYLYRLFFRLLDRKGREERKGLIIPMDSNKQGSEEARLSNLSNLFSDFISGSPGGSERLSISNCLNARNSACRAELGAEMVRL